ncbi:hypothetical protein B0I29_11167 [Actinoplanes lutulentus]|uniref:Uncharacterized protein n=1 Tax=Actinoplanes lutulentus TaxID=1287878 RepID=A0A327Z7W4_9ACTN|nr:hypothetical protein B0I29_11167 [Actinoplanes lutulentus]
MFEPGRTDVVTAVLHLIDGLTRRTVLRDAEVHLDTAGRRETRLIRNRSGLFVLLNHPAGEDLTFRVTAGRAGYREPGPITFRPSRDGVLRVVALERRADAGFGDVAVLVRGTVIRSGGEPGVREPVAGLTVSAEPPPEAAGRQFPATTDGDGVFALAVGITVAPLGEPAPVPTVLHFGADRDVAIDLEHGREHVFAADIDLDGDTVPRFTHQTGRSARP